MPLYHTLQIGAFHTLHCDDYLISEHIGHQKLLCAVMDGCTMGEDSYFAATLTGKLLRKIARERFFLEPHLPATAVSTEDLLRQVLQELFAALRQLKNQLLLDTRELLTTLILLIADKASQTGAVLVLGDGVVGINGHTYVFDQDNRPDYLGFHLDEDFDQWYARQEQKISFDTMEDIGIASDGILLFRQLKAGYWPAADPVAYLLQDRDLSEKEDMLELKLKKLEHGFGLQPTDDLAIIRLINA
ncbi:protein phosphatase 2C domain-containing protein [Taibaiella koreensis]|uniref:protein phosphatase 2C domain-containing protein n=1 Tax=Taibaiella koreensis TaxID=1268548 RepID=UPI000E59B51F|nr:protein phosphatase 2C domain-containing protein [Taibaiella koreensis]